MQTALDDIWAYLSILRAIAEMGCVKEMKEMTVTRPGNK
jgi:hypothetical protein